MNPNLKLIAAVVAIAMLPAPTLAQEATKASAQRVVSIIKADKAKTDTYCQLASLSEQLDDAEEKKDNKRADELGDQMEAQEKKLGPEYAALMTGMAKLKQDSKEVQEISTALDSLEELCKK
jgi:ABC-type transporter Mla subunit MlaD